jgi:hypothetical protein
MEGLSVQENETSFNLKLCRLNNDYKTPQVTSPPYPWLIFMNNRYQTNFNFLTYMFVAKFIEKSSNIKISKTLLHFPDHISVFPWTFICNVSKNTVSSRSWKRFKFYFIFSHLSPICFEFVILILPSESECEYYLSWSN